MADTEVLQVHEAEGHFREMLRQAGVDSAAPDSEKVWRVFQNFSRLPISEPAVLLFTCERDNQPLAPAIRLYLELQMSVYSGTAYQHTEHLTCMLCYPLTPEIRHLEDEEIVFEVGPDGLLEDFVTEVEATEQFRVLASQSQPIEILVSQGKV